jgi:hypothetical protein
VQGQETKEYERDFPTNRKHVNKASNYQACGQQEPGKEIEKDRFDDLGDGGE